MLTDDVKLRLTVNVEMPSVATSNVLVRGAFGVMVVGVGEQHPEFNTLSVTVSPTIP